MAEYRTRIVDGELRASLAAAGVVLIEGPRACGKTATARQAAKSEVLLDVDAQARALAEISPALILDGEKPRLIDEWQLAGGVWDHARRAADAHGVGQFILTGSAVPQDDKTRHVGAGRVIRLRMRPMTLSEAGRSAETVSLRSVLAGEPVRAADPGLTFDRLLDFLCVGGWPGNLGATAESAQRLLRGYLADVTRVDLRRVDGRRRDPQLVSRLLRALARNVSTAIPIAGLRRDVNGADGNHHDETISDYLGALDRLMITDNLEAWAPSLRSRTRLRSAPVRYLADPSLAIAALRANPAKLRRDVEWTGLLFENLVVRDVRVLAEALGAEAFAYRDETGLEADIVLELAGGSWAAFEVKLGVSQVDAAAANLRTLRDRVDLSVAGEPTALAVITGSGYGYTRPDGVSVIPIGALAA
jgi:predicted AAA+ superfamily ATPase